MRGAPYWYIWTQTDNFLNCLKTLVQDLDATDWVNGEWMIILNEELFRLSTFIITIIMRPSSWFLLEKEINMKFWILRKSILRVDGIGFGYFQCWLCWNKRLYFWRVSEFLPSVWEPFFQFVTYACQLHNARESKHWSVSLHYWI